MATNDKASKGSHESDNMKNLPNKNFGLTEKEFIELVSQLQGGDETLIEKIYLAHVEGAVKFVRYNSSASYEEAYDSVIDALLEIRQELIQGKLEYGNLAYLFTYRAKLKFFRLKMKNDNRLEVSSLEESIDFKDNDNFIDNLQIEEMANLIAKALNGLERDAEELLRFRFYEKLTWPKIAKILEPEKEGKDIERLSDALKKKVRRNYLPKFKKLLEKLL